MLTWQEDSAVGVVVFRVGTLYSYMTLVTTCGIVSEAHESSSPPASCVCAYVYIYIYECIYVFMYMYMHIYTHAHVRVYICICLLSVVECLEDSVYSLFI